MKKHYIEYNKLIRDKIPELIGKTGKEYIVVQHPDDIDFPVELINKIVEETGEVLEMIGKDKDKILIELSDVFEAFRTLVKNQGFTMDDVERQCDETTSRRGNFDGRNYLVKVEE